MRHHLRIYRLVLMMMIWRGRHVKVRDLNKLDNSCIAVVEVQFSRVESLQRPNEEESDDSVCRCMLRLFYCDSMENGGIIVLIFEVTGEIFFQRETKDYNSNIRSAEE